MPAIGAGEEDDEFGGGSGGELGWFGKSELVRREAVETTAVVAAGEVELGLDVVGDRPGVFDRLAIHVEDGQRAVGGVDEVNGAKPVVARADELGVLVGAAAFEG